MVPSSDPNWNYNDPEHIWEKDHFLTCVKAGLKAAQKKVISYAQGSAITQEPNKNPTYQSGLTLLRGTGDFKGQIPVPVWIRHQDKVTTATAAGPCCLQMRQSRQSPIPFITENNRRARPRPRDKACPDSGCPPGKPYGKL